MKHALRPVLLRPLRVLPPLPFAMLVHLIYQGELSTFRHPKTFTELVVAKKLHDKSPLYPITVDKLRARDYVAKRVGESCLIPLLQVVDNPRDIDFDRLEAPYVIKARHGYDMNIIVKAGETVDNDVIIETTQRWLSKNFYDNWKEWAYQRCEPGLIVEQFIGEAGQPPADCKVYVFRGKAGMIQLDSDRFTGHKVNMFDRHWNELDFRGSFPPLRPAPQRPDNLAEILETAETIAADFDFVRVDLYNVSGHVYFGEITHYPGAGAVVHKPKAFDKAIGDLWQHDIPFPDQFLRKSKDRPSPQAMPQAS